MSVLRLALVALLGSAPLVSGCSDDPQKPAPPSATAQAVNNQDIFEYLKDHSVSWQAQTASDDFPLRVSLQQPPRWLAYNQAQAPSTYLLLLDVYATDQKFTPNAILNIFKLTGNFDPKQAVLRGYTDTARTKDFHQTRESLDDFAGFPSALIEGVFTETKDQLQEAQQKPSQEQKDAERPAGDLALRVLNRYVIATSGDNKYLVQLTVTTTEGQASKLARDVKTIDEGLKLSFD